MDYITIILSIVCSIISVAIITLIVRVRIFLKLYKMNGSYMGYSFDNKPHNDREYIVYYKIWNLFRFSNYLVIKQKSPSNKYGDWTSKIIISTTNPFIASGNFKYETGPFFGAWGIQNISTNVEDRIINIETVEKHKDGIIKYYIKKNNCT